VVIKLSEGGLEVKYAATREINEKRALILPFIIDGTPIDAVLWFLRHRNAPRAVQVDS
jgi:hypothetical protein